ncbi:MAG: hypothetical protein P8144_08505, partial [Gammaproteobacteria bacterium]
MPDLFFCSSRYTLQQTASVHSEMAVLEKSNSCCSIQSSNDERESLKQLTRSATFPCAVKDDEVQIVPARCSPIHSILDSRASMGAVSLSTRFNEIKINTDPTACRSGLLDQTDAPIDAMKSDIERILAKDDISLQLGSTLMNEIQEALLIGSKDDIDMV